MLGNNVKCFIDNNEENITTRHFAIKKKKSQSAEFYLFHSILAKLWLSESKNITFPVQTSKVKNETP